MFGDGEEGLSSGKMASVRWMSDDDGKVDGDGGLEVRLGRGRKGNPRALRKSLAEKHSVFCRWIGTEGEWNRLMFLG